MIRRPVGALAILIGSAVVAGVLSAEDSGFLLASQDATGQIRSVNTNGDLDLNNPFFQDLGTNGRRCTSCHLPDQAWSITPESVQDRFDQTKGLDPIFRTNDGSNCENADVSTPAKRKKAYSLLLNRGVIRIGLNVPTNAEFKIVSVDDPNNCPANLTFPVTAPSMYRRPLPSTNLTFVSAVMWDGRESSPTTTILQDLAQQSNDATTGHAQASVPLTAAQRQAIVDFETHLFTAQARDNDAQSLHAEGAHGGPKALSQQPFFIGINDPVGLNPTNAPFDPNAFTIFNAWASIHGHDDVDEARRSIARGEKLFNSKPITISGVAGLNGQTFVGPSGPPGVTVPATITANCTICHDAPNVGNHSVKAPLNIGLTEPAVATYLPVYTLQNISASSPDLGKVVKTTDPGRAMISGKWADIGKFKGPILRGLAARAPYFHNGSAKTLGEAVDFYETRFNIGFTKKEKADLVAFLRAL